MDFYISDLYYITIACNRDLGYARINLAPSPMVIIGDLR